MPFTYDPVVITSTAGPPRGGSDAIVTGEHTVAEVFIRLNREWQPTDKAAQRWKDEITRRLEALLNNKSFGSGGDNQGTEPDLFYDTGYFYIKAGGDDIDVVHGFNQIPTRFTFWFSGVQEPQLGKDKINLVQPIIVKVVTGTGDEYTGFNVYMKEDPLTTVSIHPAKDYIVGYGASGKNEGYLRVMMWR